MWLIQICTDWYLFLKIGRFLNELFNQLLVIQEFIMHFIHYSLPLILFCQVALATYLANIKHF